MGQKYVRKLRSFKNHLIPIIIVSIFCIGIIIGSLFSNQIHQPMNSQIGEVEQLVDSFITNININRVAKPYLLSKALVSYGKQVLLIWLFGLFYMTIPLIGLLVIALGVSYGFTTSFFVIQYNLKGLLICLAAYSIQGIFFAAIVFLLSIASIQHAKKEKTVNIKVYTMYLLISFAFVIIISLFEAYVVPILIQQTITTFF